MEETFKCQGVVKIDNIEKLEDWYIIFLAHNRIIWFIDEFNEPDYVKHFNIGVALSVRDAARSTPMQVISGHVCITSASIKSE